MGKILLLVESPTKASKLKTFLGPEYIVKATFGHVVDLPLKELGVDLETLEENYVTIQSKGNIDYDDLIKQLKKLAGDADRILIGSDPDREGEAIAWHIARIFKLKNDQYDRVEIHEITQKGIKDALAAKRKIDSGLVEAQRARRVIDRLMGYGISPVLMKAVENGKSAGRVQSAALRMIVERDREHERFRPEPRYSIDGSFSQVGSSFGAYLLETPGVYDYAQPLQHDDLDIELDNLENSGSKRKKRFVSDQNVDALVQALKDVPENEWAVVSIDSTESIVRPKAPLITSTLQQLGARRFGWSGEQTMKVAQKLFENGYITYMRTDSLRIAPEAQDEARSYLAQNYGVDMVPDTPNSFKNKDAAQDAHEAIRPTHLDTPLNAIHIDSDKFVTVEDAQKLYEAIKEVYLCSQAAPGVNTITKALVEDTDGKFQFETSLTVWKFAGWRNISQEDPKPAGNLNAKEGPCQCDTVESKVSQTKPKPRYKEDTLIRDLEKNGVGRPSSYAGVMKTLKSRAYVTSKGRDVISTELGRQVTDWLNQRAAHYTDVHYTAQMEDRLDKISAGKETRLPLLEEIRDDLKKVFNAFQPRGNGEPSPKQKALLEQIKSGGEAVPDAAFQTMSAAREFLDKYMSSRGPSEKQVEFALGLSASTKMDYTDAMRMSASLTKKFIDEALVYAKKNNIRMPGAGGSDRAPSPKQIEYAKKLAADAKIAWDAELETSMDKCSAFIDKCMKDRPAGSGGGSGGDGPATAKQIEMAEKLALRHNTKYPAEYRNSKVKTSEFIDKLFNKK